MGSYEEEKAAFYANFSGSSFVYVLAVLMHVPLYSYVTRRVTGILKGCSWSPGSLGVLVELAFMVIPLFLNLTLLADHVAWTCPALVALVLCLHLCGVSSSCSVSSSSLTLSTESVDAEAATSSKSVQGGLMSNEDEVRDASNPNPDPNNTNPSRSRKDVQYVSNFRGALVLMTCLSILFVDFTVFPRYHAKTELSGVSLMDVGIGGFVFSSGLTSRFARGLSSAGSTPRNTLRVVVVAALGVGRFVCLRAFDYHEHTSEYGVHWNFFVTLAAVWLSADTLHSLVRPGLVPAIALAMLMGYQCVLAGTDLAEVVFHSPRDNLVRANREGIISLVGFTALYLLAESIAHKFIFREGLGPAVDPPVRMLAVLAASSMVLFGLTCTLTTAPVSRRLTNPAYVLAVLAICLSIVLAFATVDWALELRFGRKHGSGQELELVQGTQALLLCAFSRNQLLLFLAANLMTGAVNVCVQTIYMEDAPALALLGIYTATLCVCAHNLPRSML